MNQPLETDVRSETKDRILDAAEFLFSEAGFSATSLRQITARAGVNLAAVNYHFHSKADLLRAVMRRRIGPVNERRIAMLEQVGRSTPATLEDILRAFLKPVFDVHYELDQEYAEGKRPNARCIGNLVARVFMEPGGLAKETVIPEFRVAVERFLPAMMTALNCTDINAVLRGFQLGMGGFLIIHMREERNLPFGPNDEKPDPIKTMNELVTFMAGGIRALVDRSRRG